MVLSVPSSKTDAWEREKKSRPVTRKLDSGNILFTGERRNYDKAKVEVRLPTFTDQPAGKPSDGKIIGRKKTLPKTVLRKRRCLDDRRSTTGYCVYSSSRHWSTSRMGREWNRELTIMLKAKGAIPDCSDSFIDCLCYSSLWAAKLR